MKNQETQRTSALKWLAGTALALAMGAMPVQAQDDDSSGEEEEKEQRPLVVVDDNPFPSTYAPLPYPVTALTNATIYDGAGGRIENGTVLLQDGDIVAVGADVTIPEGANVVDAAGKWITPGIIDIHSHLGVYPSPGASAHADGNEATSPNTAEVWAEHSVWPQDPGFQRARAGGITSLQVLPGSANLIGGRAVTLKNVPSRTVQGMKFPDAPYGMKMACGENPKRVYGGRGRSPSTRMGNMAGYREAWIQAADYKKQWDEYEEKHAAGEDPNPPKRDLKLETLKGVLEGEILVHNHCYRADEMVVILDVAKEFDYHIASFHHAVEAYKIADYLREEETCASMWADWWGFKLEAYDGIKENIPFVHKAGACAIVHSDSAIGIQRLNQEASKALNDARKLGINISDAEAWTWLSLNPARAMGVADQTGTLEPGKDADVVVWDGNPFSVYTRAEKVFVDGALVYDLNNTEYQAVSDFMLGQPGEGDAR